MGLEAAEEYGSYDEVDSDQVFNGGRIPGGSGPGGEGRRRGKKPLSSRQARSRRAGRGGFSPRWLSFGIRGFEDTAKAMLAVSVGALALCAILLYATFGMGLLPAFYGSLAASIVVVALLFHTAAKLIGHR